MWNHTYASFHCIVVVLNSMISVTDVEMVPVVVLADVVGLFDDFMDNCMQSYLRNGVFCFVSGIASDVLYCHVQQRLLLKLVKEITDQPI